MNTYLNFENMYVKIAIEYVKIYSEEIVIVLSETKDMFNMNYLKYSKLFTTVKDIFVEKYLETIKENEWVFETIVEKKLEYGQYVYQFLVTNYSNIVLSIVGLYFIYKLQELSNNVEIIICDKKNKDNEITDVLKDFDVMLNNKFQNFLKNQENKEKNMIENKTTTKFHEILKTINTIVYEDEYRMPKKMAFIKSQLMKIKC